MARIRLEVDFDFEGRSVEDVLGEDEHGYFEADLKGTFENIVEALLTEYRTTILESADERGWNPGTVALFKEGPDFVTAEIDAFGCEDDE
jgi:hypothetical protein